MQSYLFTRNSAWLDKGGLISWSKFLFSNANNNNTKTLRAIFSYDRLQFSSGNFQVPQRKTYLTRNNDHCCLFLTRPMSSSASLHLRPQSPTKLLISDLIPSRKFSSTTTPTATTNNVVSFNLSDIGEGISEVVIKEWFVKLGDRVNQFDNICEVQSDKASVTITSRYDGVIHKIYYSVDDIAKVGMPLVDILLDTNVATGNHQTDHQTSKSEETPEVVTSDVKKTCSTQRIEDDYSCSSRILTTPAVRRLAMEHNINLKEVVATGKDGRILKEDVLVYINQKSKTDAVVSTVTSTVATTENNSSSKALPVSKLTTAQKQLPEDRIEPIKGITKSMFKTMTQSLSVPHFGLSDEIDLTELVRIRPSLKQIAMQKNVSLSYMPFMIKAASLALSEFPILNASLDKSNQNIVYKSSHNIGVAMDTKQGLLVPNIKSVNQLSVLEIAQELNRLHELSKRGQLRTEDLSGGTFTLSNIGSIGGLFGIPVLMPSELAIGAIGKLRQEPRFEDDTSNQIKRAYLVQVLWSADHRVIDGALMTSFSNRWKYFLENPLHILLL